MKTTTESHNPRGPLPLRALGWQQHTFDTQRGQPGARRVGLGARLERAHLDARFDRCRDAFLCQPALQFLGATRIGKHASLHRVA